MADARPQAGREPLVTAAEMRAIEAAAVARGATWAGLMERAGSEVAALALPLAGPGGALALVGPGNNGGDALVAARHLHDAGVPVRLYVWRRGPGTDENWEACRRRGIAELRAEDDQGQAALARELASADVALDGLLGSGARPAAGLLREVIAAVNAARAARPALRVVAIDLPSGVGAEDGQAPGGAVHADLTAATGLRKRGLALWPGRGMAGDVRTVEIGLTAAEVEHTMSELLTADVARPLLPGRPADAHKYTFGKALVVAGSPQYPGAASLATAGAARVGAGLVCLATGRGSIGGPGRLPEIIYAPLPEAEWGTLGEAAADELLKSIEGYRALLVGPGLGREAPTRRFLERLLGLDSPRRRPRIGFRSAPDEAAGEARAALPPAVLDADALSLLAQPAPAEQPQRRGDFFQRAPAAEQPEPEGDQRWWDDLPRGQLVLTPHGGEMARLLGVEKIDDDHVRVAEEAARAWGQVVVLKGPTTVVASPEGRTLVHDGANPALATAGTGDVLAGAIAGLVAQGLAPFDAAALGVYLHGAAGRMVREELGDAGALASDLLPRLPLAIKQLRG